jgi:hypothetical protein
MLNFGNKHPQPNIGFYLLLIQRKGECTWHTCRHRCLSPKQFLIIKGQHLSLIAEVHPTDQMDLHRQTGEMIFSTLENTSMTTAKLQVSLNNVQTQLKLEKVSSLAKDNKIKVSGRTGTQNWI